MAIQERAPLRFALIGAGYLAAYVALDYASSSHALRGLAITPWNPPAGLSLALILLVGIRAAPLPILAYLAADFAVRGQPAPIVAEIASATVAAASYATAAWLLNRLGFDRGLRRVADVVRLSLAGAAASLAVAAGQVAIFVASGALPGDSAVPAILRYWIGDIIGIVVFTPLILRLTTMRRGLAAPAETAAQAIALFAAWWLVFGWEAADEFKLFYVLFLPAMWISLRHGVSGAIVALVAVQIGLIYATLSQGTEAQTVIELQLLMLCLSVTSLLAAAAAEERRTQEAARQSLREQMGRLGRISLSGEIAAAVTHELNQPLTAFVNYLRAARHFADAADRRVDMLDALARADAQAVRAGQTLRRLRDFLRRGEMRLSTAEPARIVADAVALLEARAGRADIRIETRIAENTPDAIADRVHATQVLVNLILNAIESIEEAQPAERVVRVTAEPAGAGRVRFRVEDSGPGVAAADRERVFESFYTTRSGGMGLGLAISRTLIEAQGGRIECVAAAPGRRGAFQFELPTSGAT